MGIMDIDLGGIFDGLFKMGGELIEDKDKRNEFNMKIAEAKSEVKIATINAQTAHETALLNQTTSPWVDSFVKILIAMQPFFRPLGGIAMGLFGGYCAVKGIYLSPTIQGVLFGAFPTWGVSRHYLKSKGIK